MSQANVEVLRRVLDAFNRRDRAAWRAACDPELEDRPPREWPESQPIRGADAVFDFLLEGTAPWEDNDFEIVELIETGAETVVAQIRSEVRGKASGAAVTWNYWNVATVRDGTARRFEWFADRAEALEAAGIRD